MGLGRSAASPTRRYILTGAPGAGKTAILRALESQGCSVVEESATDVIALEQARGVPDPWTKPGFIDAITRLQRRRQIAAIAHSSRTQFYDRSPICTHALSTFLGYPISPTLRREIDRVEEERIYQKRVFFIQNLGFCAPTAVRRISFEESLRFEQVHTESYRAFGYDCVLIAPGKLSDRVDAIRRAVETFRGSGD
ncbi:MAG: AAA family ATPase [Pseudomonadota bacterium]